MTQTTNKPQTRALATVEYKPTELTTERLGAVLVKSGFFQDTRDEAQAIVKILAGRELGFGPIASMQGVYIVKGRVSLSANLVGAAIQRSGKYRYRVISIDNQKCVIDFFESGKKIGESTFTMDDARKAGLANGNYEKFARNMLFSRALTNGARWFCPEVFNGPIYTPDELGADVDDDGEMIQPLGDSLPFNGEEFIATRERDVDDADIERAREAWADACARAAELNIAHKELPGGYIRANEIERWTAALNERIAKTEGEAF